MRTTLRENLLVTFGARAAAMDALGKISLPSGTEGEDALADLAVTVCDSWLSTETDISFDEYIESALTEAYATADNREWFGIVRWHEDDIRAALLDRGFEPTEDAIDLIRLKMENRGFTDLQIAAGWDMIYQFIDDEADELEEREEY